jgi:hypothetical protein
VDPAIPRVDENIRGKDSLSERFNAARSIRWQSAPGSPEDILPICKPTEIGIDALVTALIFAALHQRHGVASVGLLGRGRPGPVATSARNIHLSSCVCDSFSQFREGLRPNSLKIGRLKFSRKQVAGAKMADRWDGEENNDPSLMLDWAPNG